MVETGVVMSDEVDLVESKYKGAKRVKEEVEEEEEEAPREEDEEEDDRRP